MELLSDPAFLSRLQFTLTVAFHFVFVPLSIGIGLVTAIAQTRAFRSGSSDDADAAHFWVKLFTTTFVIGVATGITMEFSFGTNWAEYSRFVGDIFGAPLAAEALFAFFLESVFLGVLLFGRGKVSPRM
ncbi:MAG: cytochrome ubiquinol oxidase subunit I, partial [Eggerthellaceae bacterium]|nr:cytochrome ubiquinol oxidase subunit I [Eggerthellaceae bacterium]